jgi:hypothetical protein
VPGIAGAKYKSFTDPVAEGGYVACIATLSGTPKPPASVVLRYGNPGTAPEVIAKAGDVAPGADGLPPAGGAKFKTFKAVALNGNLVAVFAQLTGGTGAEKATAANDYGVWALHNGSLRLMLREGQVIGGKTIKTLVTFAPGNGSPGCGRGWLSNNAGDYGRVLALALFADKSQGVVFVDSSNIATPSLLSLSGAGVVGGDPILGGSGHFASYGLPALTVPNTNNTSAFRGTIEVNNTDVTKATASGIFAKSTLAGAGYAIVARAGDPAGSSGVFSAFKDVALANDGGLAFPATLKATATVKGLATQTLWWKKPADSTPTLLAQGGASLVPVGDIPGAQWKAFTSLAIAAGRGPIFAATLVPKKNVVTPANASGVWACDFTGAPRLLFRTGDTNIIAGKTLKSFTLLNATVGSKGVTRSFNGSGEVVWLATFIDKSQAIVVTEVP